MSAAVKPYQVVSENHTVTWDVGLQQSVPGWEVKAVWLATNTIIPVFVPDTADLVAGTDQLVRAKGAEIDKLRSPAA